MISKTQLKKLKNFLETESKKDASKQAKEVEFFEKKAQISKSLKHIFF